MENLSSRRNIALVCFNLKDHPVKDALPPRPWRSPESRETRWQRFVAVLFLLWAVIGLSQAYATPPVNSQNFGSVNLGANQTQTVTVTIGTAGTAGSIVVSTQGIAGLDFASAASGTCATGNVYSGSQTCTVSVSFTPVQPGLREGAVQVKTSGGVVLGIAYVYGTGVGSLLRYNPGTAAIVNSNLNLPQAMVVDAGNNLYIADTFHAAVKKFVWTGSSYNAPVNVGTWTQPSGVAVDGAGNLFVTDQSTNELSKVPWNGSGYGTQVIVSSAYSYPQDLAIDGAGNLFILSGASTISKLPWNGTAYGAATTIGSGFSGGEYNTDVVDSVGNIYVADCNNGTVVKEAYNGTNYSQQTLLNYGNANCIDGVAVDPAGNIYIADFADGSTGTAQLLPWNGTGYGAPITLTSTIKLEGPEAIYLDSIGNIYIEDYTLNFVEKWSVTALPTITFPTHTNVGSADATDNPQSVSLLNIGNAALNIFTPQTGLNPSFSSGYSYANSSTCLQLTTSSEGGTLDSGASCNYAVNFTPTAAGVNSGTFVLMDDYDGAVSTTQTIFLSGTGVSTVTKLAFATPPATPIGIGGNAGSAVTVNEELSSSAIATYGADVITLTVTGPSAYSHVYTQAASSGVATFNLGSVALNAGGTYTYTASLTSVASAVASETVNSLTAQTITGFAPATPVTFGVSPISLTATGGGSGNPVTFSVVSGSGTVSGTNGATLTVTGAGTIVIAANQAGNGSYAAATQVTASIVVNGAVTATQSVATTTLTVNHAAATFVPVSGSGGTVPLSYRVSPALPAGLTLSTSTGAISGTPTAASAATTYTVTVTDANNATATSTFNLTVNSAVAAAQSVASTKLTVNHAATSFTPVTGSGGTAPLSYSVSPSLPAGLSILPTTGAITGTATATSPATTYTVTVTDANSATATAMFSLTVNSAVTATQSVASTTLTVNHAATSFSPVSGSGGTTPLTYSVSPSLPAGLSISPTTGAIIGTATASSAATTYTVAVTDSNGASSTATFSLAVNAAVAASQSVASTTLTVNHTATSFAPVTGSGGTTPLTYSVSPSLPAGMSISPSTGAVTGTPTLTIAASTYTVTVSDANSATATATFSLAVNAAVAATQAVATVTLTVNHAATSFTPVTGSGGTTPLTYTVSPSLPAGLSISPTTGAITGIATATSGATAYTVTVTDANNATATSTFSMAVNASVAATQSIASVSLTVNHATTSFTPVTGSGGTAPLTYSVSPSLPAGLSISSTTGAVTSTPTVISAATTYTVTVTDTNNATAMATFSLTVNSAVSASQSVASTTLTVNHAATSFTPVTGSGGTAPLSFSVSPSLPAGLSISSTTGAITGTPTVTIAATTYTVTVTDANIASSTATFSLTVNSAVAATQSMASVTLTVNHAATSFTPVTGSGGTTPLTYSVSPSLPAGLSISPTTGAITGTPTVTGAATTYTVTVTDANSATATATFSLAANAAVAATQAVATTRLTMNHAATPFTPVTGSGGTAPLTYGVSPSLPAGLSISPTTGAITGAATVTSSATTYTVTVTDANSATAMASFSLAVNNPVVSTQSVPTTTLGVNLPAPPFTPVAGSGGSAPLTYSVSPSLPAGLSISPTTGAITGTPILTSAATTYTITVTDSNSATATATFSLTVASSSQTITFFPVTPVTYGISPITLTATGGASENPVTFTIFSGPGTLSGTNNGTLTVTGAGTIVIAANQTGNANYSAAMQVTTSIVVSHASQTISGFAPATPLTLGVAPIALIATGGASENPVTFTIVSGPGSLSGTNNSMLTVTGAGTIVIAARQAGNANYSAATQVTASILVNSAVVATQSVAIIKLTMNHAAMPFAPVTGSGGTAPLAYSVSPALSAGLSISPTTGVITGTSTAISAATMYTVTVTDANSATATATFNLTVNAAVAATQSVPATTLTMNHAATTFAPVSGSGGAVPLTYSVNPSLPAGLSISSSTGAITGTATATSIVTRYTVTVIDANSATATATFNLTVNAAVAATQSVAATILTMNHAATPFSPVSGSGGTVPLTYSVNPSLPAGLNISPTTGAITGTATATTIATTYTVTVTDANSAMATATFGLTVSSAVAAAESVATTTLGVNLPAPPFTPVTGSGGTVPLTYSVSPALPTGLSISPTIGAVTGTPTTIGPAAAYTVTVTDANGATATAIFNLTVASSSQTITFSPASPVTYGISPITLTATGGASENPITFVIVSGPGTLSGTNSNTLTVTGAGTIVIAANQAGSASYAAAPQVNASILVNCAAQTITAFAPATPLTYGVSPITLSATGGGSENPVIFSIVSGPGTLSGINGNVLTVNSGGTIVVAANQAGNANYSAAAQVSASIVVHSASQTIIGFAPITPVVFGVSPIRLTATGGASGKPVIFSIVSGPGTLGGTKGDMLTVNNAGTIVVAANQAGNTSYSAAAQVTATIFVNREAQSITLIPLMPVAYGVSPITLSATGGASDNPVTFSVVSGPGVLSGSNQKALTVTGAGTILIAANQAGNASYAAATEVRDSIVVNRATLDVTVNPASSVYGAAFPIFTGKVTGIVNGDPITATYSTSATPQSPVGGSYSIAATLVDPDSRLGDYSVVNTPGTLTVTQATPAVGLAASANPVMLLNPVEFTATLTGATIPTGSVKFMDNDTVLGVVSVVNGVSTLKVTNLAVGTHSITAAYSGDADFAATTSAFPINESVQDFSLAISVTGGSGSVTSVTALPGGKAVYDFTVSPVNALNFPETVMLSASGLPRGATYVFSPAQLSAGSGSTKVMLTVQLPPPTLAATPPAKHDSSAARSLAPMALALLLLPLAGRIRKTGGKMSRYLVLLVAVGLLAAAGLSGCGSKDSGFFGQAAQTFSVTVTGTSGPLSHSTKVTLTVE
jgi:hypothetical protein